ncbi:MAG: LCP family protein [Tumebacillaceae bacterium]
MKRWQKAVSVLGAVLVVGAGVLGYEYWKLQPERQLAHEHPVLGETHAPSASTAPSTAPAEPGAAASAGGETGGGQKQEEAISSFTVLLLGLDGRDGDALTRSDVIMIAHVNPKQHAVHLVSIPRDTRVNLPSIGMTKINHAYVMAAVNGGDAAGKQAAIQAVSDFMGVPVNYHVSMNFDGFERFVNEIGGVELTLPNDIGPIPAGPVHAGGELALDLVRERYSLPGGETDRQANQAMVLKAIVQKLLTTEYVPKLPGLYQQMRQDVLDTNFSEADLVSLALLYKNTPGDAIEYRQIPGHAGAAFDPLLQMELSYWIPKMSEVQEIAKVFLQD